MFLLSRGSPACSRQQQPELCLFQVLLLLKTHQLSLDAFLVALKFMQVEGVGHRRGPGASQPNPHLHGGPSQAGASGTRRGPQEAVVGLAVCVCVRVCVRWHLVPAVNPQRLWWGWLCVCVCVRAASVCAWCVCACSVVCVPGWGIWYPPLSPEAVVGWRGVCVCARTVACSCVCVYTGLLFSPAS